MSWWWTWPPVETVAKGTESVISSSKGSEEEDNAYPPDKVAVPIVDDDGVKTGVAKKRNVLVMNRPGVRRVELYNIRFQGRAKAKTLRHLILRHIGLEQGPPMFRPRPPATISLSSSP